MIRRTTPKNEIQRDPIYLLQSGRLAVTVDYAGEYDSDLECVVDDEGNEVSDEQGLEKGWYETIWETHSVWMNRQEAKDFAEATSYNFRGGWRTFAVSAMGDLKNLLEPITTKEVAG